MSTPETIRGLLEQYRHQIYGLSYYYLGRKEDAEDVTQEVLVRLWKHADKVDPAKMKAWVVKVTGNACKDCLRKRKRKHAVMNEQLNDEFLEERAADAGASPAAQLAHQELRQHIEAGLQTLPEKYRFIVILREVQQKSYTEISQALGIPLSRVKVYLHRGRKMLREALREKMRHDGI